MIVTHYGHACLLVETEGARLLFDPGTLSSGFEGERDLTAILITHNHADHLDVGRLAALLAANPAAVLVADHDSIPLLDGLDPTEVSAGDRLEFGGSVVDVVGEVHAPVYGNIPGNTNVAYLIDGGAFYHPGDSFVVPEVAVEVLALPTSGPWLKVSDAIEFVRAISPAVAIPMHEQALADTTTHYEMIGGLSPESTAFTPLEAGKPTTVRSPR